MGAGESDGAGVLHTRNRGYALILDPERVDSVIFERLLAEGNRELAAGRADSAADAFERALALWRGPPLAGLEDEAFAKTEIRRLGELRAAAFEHLVETDLALGRHADVAGRLPALIGEYPHRERLRAQLMLALYRCDRQTDALQAFQDARHALVEQFGIEPGELLRAIHSRVLAQDPTLRAPLPPRVGSIQRLPPPAGARRIVTVMVANVAGSPTEPFALHDLRAVSGRAALCADVIERHGGSVERFDGDTVVGMFGLRELHEDDALRAVRAALELRVAGISTVGINSGEAVLGTGPRGETFAAGDVKRLAARLGDVAEPGEILLGLATQGMVQRQVLTEPLPARVVRGRRVEVPAVRLLDLRTGGADLVPAASPFVGRERESATLRALLATAERESRCLLVTVAGPGGIGKSRLAQEFIAGAAGGARVVVGRCQSYGDGAADRPLAEIVDHLTGGDPAAGIAELLQGHEEAESISRLVLRAIGLAEGPAQILETSGAVRRLLEAAAQRQPLVVVIDDAHVAASSLLDLVEYVVAFSSGFPILLVLLTRPEFLEGRSEWATSPDRSILHLDPLSDTAARAFVDSLAGDALGAQAKGQIVETADGNPLFLEQLVAVGAETGVVTLPPTVNALLRARIDVLEADERTVLLHAAVEGRRFHRGAVGVLMPDTASGTLATALMRLVRKGLIRPDRPRLPGEDAFRFTHALIHEAAYHGVPEAVRADEHERLARWLDGKSHVPDEIVGYHLEQAFVLRDAIAAATSRDRAIAAEASRRLGTAARAALSRGDAGAGAQLLQRAARLLGPEHPRRPEILSTLGAALIEAGQFPEADRVLAEAIERAVLEGDTRIESRARVDREFMRQRAGTGRGHARSRRVARAAVDLLQRHGDDVGVSHAWRLEAWLDWDEGLVGRADESWQHAAAAARRAGDEGALLDILAWRASAAVLGPIPVPEAIGLCGLIREEVGDRREAVALTLQPLGLLHAMKGEFGLARQLSQEAKAILDALGRMESAVSHHEALAELLAGRPEKAEALLRPGYEKHEAMGEHGVRATTAALLARAVFAQERYDEADQLSRLSERLADAEDAATHAMWRGTQARLHALRGELDQADRLAREAVRIAEPTDFLVVQADALVDLAAVADLDGRVTEARSAVHRALVLYERKGDLVSAARTRLWERSRSLSQDSPAPM